jgi:protein-S-isoprenylcysteine O-methyltransferase Ste14
MVFGASMIYLALIIDLDSVAAMSLVILSLPVAILYLRKTEERRLLVDFGQEYEDYRRRVPMIVPWFPRD